MTPQTTSSSGRRAPTQPLGDLHELLGALVVQIAELHPYPGAVGGDEGQQRVVARVAARATVRADELVGQRLGVVREQVHDEIAQVGADVDLAQRRVELHAVKHLDPAVADDHVLQAQVPVAVAHAPVARPPTERGAARDERCVEEALRGRERVALGRRQVEVKQRLEVLVDLALGRTRPRGIAWQHGAGVKRRDAPRDRVNVIDAELAGLNQRRHRPLLGQPSHLNRPFQRAAVIGIGEPEAVFVAHDRTDPEIGLFGKAPVQAHLLEAQRAPTLGVALIQERQHHRLLELVHQLAREEHDRDRRLAHLYLRRLMPIEAGMAHRRADLLEQIRARRRVTRHRGPGRPTQP